jgi:GTPase SAR1 family protein
MKKGVWIMTSIELKNLLERYKFDNLLEDMESLEKDIILKIGFLGEFSSGKSTLINKMLDQKILPVMDEPTSKTIVEIEGADIEEPEYYRYDGTDREAISAYEFSELCTTPGEYTAYLKLPFRRFLKNGYLFIDTPGISSIDRSDEDITFGYLPNLDAAILCQDIQKGALNRSILEFILRPEVKPLVNNFIFVITKSDTKPEPEKIRRNIVEELQKFNMTHKLGMENIEKRVVLSGVESGVDEMERVIDSLIFKRKQKLQNERREKEYRKIAQKALALLKEQKKNSSLDLDDIKEEEAEVEKSIEALKNNEKALYDKLDRFEERLQDDIRSILRARVSDMAEVNDLNELQEQISIIERSIVEKANMRAERYIGNAGFESIDGSTMSTIRDDVKSILKGANIAKQLVTFILFSVILPGAGAAANAAEGGGGLAVREAAKNSVKSVGEEVAKEAAKKAIFSKVIKKVLDIFDKINPVEIVGDIIQGKMIQSKFEENIPQMSTNLAFAIRSEMEDRLEELFVENREEMQNKKTLLNTLYEKKREKGKEFSTYIEGIDKDIRNLLSYE